jgi:RNA polymerase sigma-70 factor (ECF subfamily)
VNNVGVDATTELTSTEDIAHRIQQGDLTAEQELVRQYGPRIEFVLQRHCRDPAMAADLTQDTLMIALRKLRNEGLRDPKKLAAFLHRTAMNLATGEARTYYRRNTHADTELIQQQLAAGPSLCESLEREELRQLVRQLLGELKRPRDQHILYRYYLSEESKERICADLGVSHHHFDRVLHRARNRFRDLIVKHLGKDFSYE